MKVFAALFAALYYLIAAPVLARDDHSLARIPVLHEGRIKPLDTVARIMLQQFHGSDSFGNASAITWMAELLFDPETAMNQPVFCVPSPSVRAMIELPQEASHCYSYRVLSKQLETRKNQITQIAAKSNDTLSASEKAIWQLYEDVADFSQLAGSFSLLLPLDIEVPQGFDIKVPQGKPTYRDLVKHLRPMREALGKLVKQRGEDFNHYTPAQQQLALCAFLLDSLEAAGRGNQLLRVVPAQWNDSQEWYSPWALLQSGQGSPQSAQMMQLWQQLAQSYHENNADEWQKTAQMLTDKAMQQSHYAAWLLDLEIGYNTLNLIPKAALVYALALAIGITALAMQKPVWWRIAVSGSLLGLAMHGLVIVTRMVLLGRPPVSSLYESILFVAWIAAAYGLWLAKRHREGLLVGLLLAALLLAISGTYASQGDSMGMLIAVLNTRFWLATHVVCITIGYGCALIAGSLAHLALIPSSLSMRPRASLLLAVTVIALLFTSVGTILGGVWADQSWGRFWGWDPKENGALLIVLWLIWLLHGRMTRYIDTNGFAAWLALTNVVVALSWFGVNLLNVGLHSYGFTDAAAAGLAVFCAAEVITICVLYGLTRRREREGI